MQMKQLIRNIAADVALLATSATLGAVALVMRELTAAATLGLVAIVHLASIINSYRQASGTLEQSTPLTEEAIRMIIARETGKLRELGGFVGEESVTPAAAAPLRTVRAEKIAKMSIVNDEYIVFRPKPAQSQTGSDLIDLDDALKEFDTTSNKILVLTEFKSQRPESLTLESQIAKGGRLNELICHGIFTNVDVIPHVGKDAWKKRDEIVKFIAELAPGYKNVVIWLPEEEYFAWTGVIDHFGSAATRLFNESVI
jgi:hypothetical protein